MRDLDGYVTPGDRPTVDDPATGRIYPPEFEAIWTPRRQRKWLVFMKWATENGYRARLTGGKT